MSLNLRPAAFNDIEAMRHILNEIITIGGTTAQEQTLTQQEFISHYLESNELISCLVALNSEDTVLGFQSLHTKPSLESGWGNIATFTQRDSGIRGVGRALFSATVELSNQLNISHINANIRADNVPGLGYYSSIGFTDYAVAKGVPLSDGTPVDRVSKVYAL